MPDTGKFKYHSTQDALMAGERRDTSTLEKHHQRMFIAFCFFGVSLLLLFSGCSNDLDLRMLRSSFSYQLYIRTSEPVFNVTLYLPLPVKNGEPALGKIVLDEDLFIQKDFTVSFTQMPPGGENFTWIDEFPGKKPWFVKLSTYKILPKKSEDIVYSISLYNSTEVIKPDLFINTLFPVGNESLFLPKYEFLPESPRRGMERFPHQIEYSEVRSPYKIRIFANYEASPTSKVIIASSLRGSNSWKEHYDSSIANLYSDNYEWIHTGDSEGWDWAGGVLYAGVGIYPNLSSPEWQNVIEESRKRT